MNVVESVLNGKVRRKFYLLITLLAALSGLAALDVASGREEEINNTEWNRLNLTYRFEKINLAYLTSQNGNLGNVTFVIYVNNTLYLNETWAQDGDGVVFTIYYNNTWLQIDEPIASFLVAELVLCGILATSIEKSVRSASGQGRCRDRHLIHQ